MPTQSRGHGRRRKSARVATDLFTIHNEKALPQLMSRQGFITTPKGIRTPVLALRGLCPRPLDDGGGCHSFKRDSAERQARRLIGSSKPLVARKCLRAKVLLPDPLGPIRTGWGP